MILGALIVVSAVTRSIVAWHHSIPRLFPDEYIYAALGRSLGQGHLEIRGATAHFPAILEPLAAAPIWRLFDVTTAYHLVQVENAVAASLAAIPVFLLARYLRLTPAYSLAAAAYALLIPELVIVAFTSSDALGYLLAAGAVTAGVASLDEPTLRRQALFLVLAALATLTRVEYAVLAPAYVVAAFAVDRRQALRLHRLTFGLLAPGAAAALIGATLYYSPGLSGWVTKGYGEWLLLELFLLALEIGVVAAPGALLGFVAWSGRREKVFALFCGTFAICLLAVAARVASEKSEFKERYLFILLALAPIACGLYLRKRPARAPVAVGVAIAIAIAVARLPISAYAVSSFKTDSQFLFAAGDLLARAGTDTGSLIVALVATVGAVLAAYIAYRGPAFIPVAATIAVAAVATASATRVDLTVTRSVRSGDPHDLRWVDHAAQGPVFAIETPVTLKQDLLSLLYWNTSVQRELLLGNAFATDAFSAPRLVIDPDGTLPQVHGEVLFHDFGTTGRLADARRIASAAHFTLWRPANAARLRLVIQGRFFDGWLNPTGRLRAWGQNPTGGVRVSFRLSLPPTAKRVVRVFVAGRSWLIRPGTSVDVACTGGRALNLRYRATGRTILQTDLRRITARMTHVSVSDVEAPTAPACGP